MKLKTLSSYNFKDKFVLLRSDLNSDVVNGKVLESERIKESARTIKELKSKGARIVIIAHQGRKGKDDCVSLSQHAKQLNKYVKVEFVDDTLGSKAIEKIKELKSGRALLLENVRFIYDELEPNKKDNKFLKLIGLFDFCVNDAFSVSHREQASITLFPKFLKSCIGRLMESEIKAIEKVKLKDTLFILGGNKAEDNIKLLKKAKGKVITCGIFGQLCVIGKGKNLGAQNGFLKNELKYIPELKKLVKSKKVLTPIDFAVNKDNKRVEIPLSSFPSEYEIFDIGSKTIEIFVEEIKKAKSVYMKGTAGYCEDDKFTKGTFNILKAIASMNKNKSKGKKAFSLMGGGHLSNAIAKSKIPKSKFGYISLSGGALITYLSGEKLVGVEELKR